MEVIWKPPWSWIKVNCDKASLINSGTSTYGGIFRYHNGGFDRAFSNYLGVSDSLISELLRAIPTIEFTNEKGWKHIWLE